MTSQDDRNFDIRKLRSKLIKINSDDKTPTSVSNSNFTINLPSTAGVIDSIAGLSTQHISCPNMFPNIASYNNVFNLFESTAPGTPIPVTLTVGQYSLSEFLVELKTVIDTAITPDTVAVTIEEPLKKLKFVFTGGLYGFNITDSTAAKKLGYIADVTAAATVNMPLPINLIGETERYVHCRQIAPSQMNEPDGQFSVVAIVPLNVEYGGVCYYVANDYDLNTIAFSPHQSKKTFRVLHIKLRNSNGDILPLPDNFTFNFVGRIYY